ncbi:hypothetical protein LPV64_19145, partial [Ralstonia pseudosolanacearum]|nr:hypothetical protein [Ralstonia pseudosolanacearum]
LIAPAEQPADEETDPESQADGHQRIRPHAGDGVVSQALLRNAPLCAPRHGGIDRRGRRIGGAVDRLMGDRPDAFGGFGYVGFRKGIGMGRRFH